MFFLLHFWLFYYDLKKFYHFLTIVCQIFNEFLIVAIFHKFSKIIISRSTLRFLKNFFNYDF